MSQYRRNFTPQFDFGEEEDRKHEDHEKTAKQQERLATKRTVIPTEDFLTPQNTTITHKPQHNHVISNDAQEALEQRCPSSRTSVNYNNNNNNNNKDAPPKDNNQNRH